MSGTVEFFIDYVLGTSLKPLKFNKRFDYFSPRFLFLPKYIRVDYNDRSGENNGESSVVLHVWNSSLLLTKSFGGPREIFREHPNIYLDPHFRETCLDVKIETLQFTGYVPLQRNYYTKFIDLIGGFWFSSNIVNYSRTVKKFLIHLVLNTSYSRYIHLPPPMY